MDSQKKPYPSQELLVSLYCVADLQELMSVIAKREASCSHRMTNGQFWSIADLVFPVTKDLQRIAQDRLNSWKQPLKG